MEPKFIIDVSDKKTRKLFENQLTKRGFISYFPKLIDWKLQKRFFLKLNYISLKSCSSQPMVLERLRMGKEIFVRI